MNWFRALRVLQPLLMALAVTACDKPEGIFVVVEEGSKPITMEEYVGPDLAAEVELIFDRFDGMVADQSLPELLQLGVQRRAEIAGVITRSQDVEEMLSAGIRMPFKVYREPLPKLDQAVNAALEDY